MWTHVRDDRPFGGPDPPAAAFFYSPDRRGEHPEGHLAGFAGILQADAYGGFNRLYEPDRKPGPVLEAACWAHARRKFFVLAEIGLNARHKVAVVAPLAVEAVKRIDAIFDQERMINGAAAADRLALRQATIAPLVADLETWMRGARAKLSRMPRSRGRWTTCSSAGRRSPASSTTAGSASRTTPPSGRSAVSLSAASRGCSAARTGAASARPSCTR